MNTKRSILLIISGIILILFTIFNFFINIPDYLSNLQIERNLQGSAQNANELGISVAQAQPINQRSSQTIPTEPTPKTIVQAANTPGSTPTPSLPVDIHDGYIPDRIIIPAISLDAPVVQSDQGSVELRNQWFDQWSVPNEFAAGWLPNSAPLGMVGNTVLAGHHNEFGEVFGHLIDLQIGDQIYVYSGKVTFAYRIVDKLILKEKNVAIDIRTANAQWIASTTDERLTLVTCWPHNNNTHRLIIVAVPVVDTQSASLK